MSEHNVYVIWLILDRASTKMVACHPSRADARKWAQANADPFNGVRYTVRRSRAKLPKPRKGGGA